jgi:hypothetical protein
MSVQWTIARAVGAGLVKSSLPFIVTAKGGVNRLATDFPAFWETVIGATLAGSAALLHLTNFERVNEIRMFAIVLAVQSLPFLSAGLIALLERLRINDFAFWRGVRLSVARGGRLGRRAPDLLNARVQASGGRDAE